jgi:hypothetical protein
MVNTDTASPPESMAEAIGVATGFIGVAGVAAQLGVYCFQIYGFYEDAKGLGQDLTDSGLTLDILKHRLNEWKQTISHRAQHASLQGQKDCEYAIRELLALIPLIEEAEKLQAKYENRGKASSSISSSPTQPLSIQLNGTTNLDKALHDWKILVKSIQDRATLSQKVTWALSDRKKLEELMEKLEKKANRLKEHLSASPSMATQAGTLFLACSIETIP